MIKEAVLTFDQKGLDEYHKVCEVIRNAQYYAIFSNFGELCILKKPEVFKMLTDEIAALTCKLSEARDERDKLNEELTREAFRRTYTNKFNFWPL